MVAFQQLPPTMRRSLTWDRGVEMTRHTDFTAATGIPVYFCDAYCPWQRGSNENSNGLLRQYFPTCMGCSDAWSGRCP
jgi:IS30 family transposase